MESYLSYQLLWDSLLCWDSIRSYHVRKIANSNRSLLIFCLGWAFFVSIFIAAFFVVSYFDSL
jgi:hypothetical protein